MAVVSEPPNAEREAPAPAVPAAVRVVAVANAAALAEHVAAWEDLAANAVEPNVFFEPWMLLPAVRAFSAGQQLLLLFVYGPDAARPQGPGRLLGFFPLERVGRYKGLPVTYLRLWQHLHCSLCTPLIRQGAGRECLDALFRWLATDRRGSRLLQLNFVAADGPFYHLLLDHLNERRLLTYLEESTTRALLRVAADDEAYLAGVMSGGSRKELRRQRRRLGELGTLESLALDNAADLDTWVDQFLALEASGWKGQEGTALGVRDADREFFRTVAHDAFARGRLMLLGLFLDGRPVALKCNFLMGAGAVAFKIAYDETHARFSPGVQLELDNIVAAHRRPGLRWMDSCAVSRHPMINRLWPERRTVQTVVVATGRRGGDLAVSVLPLLRWLRRCLSRGWSRKQPSGDTP
jgi:CelD/BcsL family acetyltransferase involved in cellulose biosynthesis